MRTNRRRLPHSPRRRRSRRSFRRGITACGFRRAGQLSETSRFDAGVGGYYNVSAALAPRHSWSWRLSSDEAVEIAHLDEGDDVLLAHDDLLVRLNAPCR